MLPSLSVYKVCYKFKFLALKNTCCCVTELLFLKVLLQSRIPPTPLPHKMFAISLDWAGASKFTIATLDRGLAPTAALHYIYLFVICIE